MTPPEQPGNNEECADRLDELSNLLADAATEILEAKFEEAKTIIEEIETGMVDVKAYIASMYGKDDTDD